ncbi:hypothetical protein ACFUTV_40820 [Streptomyces sp. NPDC057298]|uniref:hypothetical protein n=1 Tax=Streptomyces sp. NPDC057298 TaxID=3346091 RepID=UPI00363306B7
MNVARPGRPLGPVPNGLPPPVRDWVRVFRAVVMEQLLRAEPPLTLEEVSKHLVEQTGHQQRPVGAAGADRLQSVQSGRGVTSVQRMVSGQLVPTRDVVLHLLQLLADRGLAPGGDVEELWQLYRPALRSRRPDVAEAYDIIDERDAALGEAAGLRQQVRALEADQRRALLSATRAGLRLLGVHRALATTQKEVSAATGSRDLARAQEHEARAHLEAAVDRLDRLRDAYEQMCEQAEAVAQEAVSDRAQWHEHQALLLERLARAEEALAQAIQNTEDAREELADERRTARMVQKQTATSRADATVARQEAAVAQRALSEAENHHTEAVNRLTRLETELHQIQAELRQAEQRLLRADGELVQAKREQAVEADAQDVLTEALTNFEATEAFTHIEADEWSAEHALIFAGPEPAIESTSEDLDDCPVSLLDSDMAYEDRLSEPEATFESGLDQKIADQAMAEMYAEQDEQEASDHADSPRTPSRPHDTAVDSNEVPRAASAPPPPSPDRRQHFALPRTLPEAIGVLALLAAPAFSYLMTAGYVALCRLDHGPSGWAVALSFVPFALAGLVGWSILVYIAVFCFARNDRFDGMGDRSLAASWMAIGLASIVTTVGLTQPGIWWLHLFALNV